MKRILTVLIICISVASNLYGQPIGYPYEYPLYELSPPLYIPDKTEYIYADEYFINEEQDTVKESNLYWQFDERKNLISWQERKRHYAVEIEYDEQNRPVEKEGFYDESSSNGTSRWVYPSPNRTIEYPANVNAEIAVSTERFYDSRKRLVRELVKDTVNYDERYALSFEKDTISERIIRYEYLRDTDKPSKIQTFLLPGYLTLKESEYLYDPNERIVRETHTYYKSKSENLIQEQRIIVYGYFSSEKEAKGLHRVQEVEIGLVSDLTEMAYSFGDNFVRVKKESPTSKGKYGSGHGFSDQKWVYEGKKLVRRDNFDEKGEIVSWVKYRYQYRK